MKLSDVPNDALEYKDRNLVRKKMYATNDDGSYTSVPSVGWEVENMATEDAWLAAEEAIAKTKTQFQNREISSIRYFQIKALMDLAVLASHVGKWQWQVKRMWKPEAVDNASDEKLQPYAKAFGISIGELRNPTL